MGADPAGVPAPPADDRWLTHPFASTFDLILSEYAGYTDQSLLDVTLGRLHQMRESIFARKKEDRERELLLVEAELQHICGAIYAAAGSKDGVKAAARIQLFERPKRIVIPSDAQVRRMFGG